ncbi:MAG: hypothetical protein AN490_08815, partial [Anabaena sp. AL09]
HTTGIKIPRVASLCWEPSHARFPLTARSYESEDLPPSVLILNPLSHKTSCTKCVAYFHEEVPGKDAFGVNYGNTNNFLDNPSKIHRINILALNPEIKF